MTKEVEKQDQESSNDGSMNDEALEKLFTEVSEERTKASASEAAAYAAEREDKESSEKEKPAPESETKKDEKPAPEKGTEKSQKADEVKGTSKQEPDWRESLSEQAKQELTRLAQAERLAAHKERSYNGRVAGLNRKIKELTDQLAQLESSSKKEDKGATETPIEEIKVPDLKDTEAFAKFSERYPSIADAIRAQIKAGVEALAKTPKSTPPKAESPQPKQEPAKAEPSAEDKEYIRSQKAKLLEAVPNCEQIVETPFFAEFLDQLPPTVRALADSDDADDWIHLFLNEYAPYYSKCFPENAAASAPAKTEDQELSSSKAEQARNRRAAALEDTAIGGRQPRPGVSGVAPNEGDYDTMFNQIVAAKARKAG